MANRIKSILQYLCIGVLFVGALAKPQKHDECCQEYCYGLDDVRPQSAHFASKTAYSFVRGPISARQYIVPSGTEQLSLLEHLRDEIIANYESKPAVRAMCAEDLDLLKKWHYNWNLTDDMDTSITAQGSNEIKSIAVRYQRAFPNILGNTYDPSKFSFRYTQNERTEASLKAFAEGLFGTNATKMIHLTRPSYNDPLLKPYFLCPPHMAFNATDDKTEYTKFIKSQTIIQLTNDVSKRLGFEIPLKIDQILDIFDMCRFDQAWVLDKPSAWCAAFTPIQINVLEYLEDLSLYYENGFGRPQNARLKCTIVNDMVQHLKNNAQLKFRAHFAHSHGILLVLTALQAVKDSDTLRADNYNTVSRRKYRTSEIVPFAANLAAIKFECPNDVDQEKVMFFLNEKPLHFDWCNPLCNLKDVEEQYKEFSQVDCDEYFCSDKW